MPEWLVQSITIAAAVGSGLMAGAFMAFSTFVMAGLRDVPDATGLSVMQAINRRAPRGLFVTTLMLTALLAVAVIVVAFLPWTDASPLRIAGGIASLVQMGMTAGFHVPRNDRLDRLDASSASSRAAWRAYARTWTSGNHVRTLASLVGLVLLVLAAVAT